MLYIQEVFTVIGNTLIGLGLTSSSWVFYLSDDRWSSVKYCTVIRELRCVINHVYMVNYISCEVIIPHDYKGRRGRVNPDVCISSFLQKLAKMEFPRRAQRNKCMKQFNAIECIDLTRPPLNLSTSLTRAYLIVTCSN